MIKKKLTIQKPKPTPETGRFGLLKYAGIDNKTNKLPNKNSNLIEPSTGKR